MKKKRTYEFLPLVKDTLKKLISPTATEVEIQQSIKKFRSRMESAHKIIESTRGLELTEEEQIKRIEELKVLIVQKRQLIEDCNALLEEWKANPIE